MIAGGLLTTVANALLSAPEIAPNLIVFNLTVTGGYNGKDGWAAYIVTKKTRYVDWGGGSFWDKESVFNAEHFSGLPDNTFTEEMKRFIRTDLGRANQLGDGAPLVWLYETKCWKEALPRKTVYEGDSVRFVEVNPGEAADVLVIPKPATDLKRCREEFFREMADPGLFRR